MHHEKAVHVAKRCTMMRVVSGHSSLVIGQQKSVLVCAPSAALFLLRGAPRGLGEKAGCEAWWVRRGRRAANSRPRRELRGRRWTKMKNSLDKDNRTGWSPAPKAPRGSRRRKCWRERGLWIGLSNFMLKMDEKARPVLSHLRGIRAMRGCWRRRFAVGRAVSRRGGGLRLKLGAAGGYADSIDPCRLQICLICLMARKSIESGSVGARGWRSWRSILRIRRAWPCDVGSRPGRTARDLRILRTPTARWRGCRRRRRG